jgi:hypothetical protein
LLSAPNHHVAASRFSHINHGKDMSVLTGNQGRRECRDRHCF